MLEADPGAAARSPVGWRTRTCTRRTRTPRVGRGLERHQPCRDVCRAGAATASTRQQPECRQTKLLTSPQHHARPRRHACSAQTSLGLPPSPLPDYILRAGGGAVDVEPRQTVDRPRASRSRAGAWGLVARPWRGGRGRARTASALGKGMRGPPGGLAVHREGVGRRPTGVSARRRGRARRETRGLARAARRARLAWRGSHRRSHPGNPRLVRRSPPRNAFPTPPPPPQAPRARS